MGQPLDLPSPGSLSGDGIYRTALSLFKSFLSNQCSVIVLSIDCLHICDIIMSNSNIECVDICCYFALIEIDASSLGLAGLRLATQLAPCSPPDDIHIYIYMYIYIYIYIFMYIHIYIYIYRERERHTTKTRERERDREREREMSAMLLPQ